MRALTPPSDKKLDELWSGNHLNFVGAFAQGGLHAGLCHAFLVQLINKIFSRLF